MNNLKPHRFICLILVLLIAGSARPVQAQTGPDSLAIQVETGFDGYAKTDTWTPVYVIAANTGPAVEGEIRVKTDYPGETYARRLSLPAQSQKEVTLFAMLRGSGEYTLEFVSDSGQTLFQRRETPRLISQFGLMVGVIASDTSLLNFLAGLQPSSQGAPVTVSHLTPARLPAQTAGLSAFDVLVFNDVDTAVLTPAQQKALLNWVTLGGRLIVGGGPNAAATLAGLSNLMPATALTTKTFADLTGLEKYIGRAIPEQGPYLAAIPQIPGATADLLEHGEPFLAHKKLGRGKVTYFALDFGLAPMNGWAGNDAFWRRVLGAVQSTPPFYATYDATRYINDALANIAATGLPSPAFLLTYLCLYFLALVPLNYFVLKRLKRRELAWVTIPALIILFTLAGYIAGFRNRGGEAILRQISVIRQVSGAEEATIDTFVGLYSPVRDHYTLRFQEDALVQPTEGGRGFSGIKTTASAPTAIYYGSRTELRNLWTDIGSMSTVLAHGQVGVAPVTLNISLERQGSRWRVSGQVTNNTGQTLDDAILLVGKRGVQLSGLKPGQTDLDHPLKILDTQLYNDTNLWGEYYYQLNDVQGQVNDQIIKSIFWPGAGPGPSSGLSDPNLAILLGWPRNAPAGAGVEVVGHRVQQDVSNLLIVTGRVMEP